MTTMGRPLTSAQDKLEAALAKGRGCFLQHRDVMSLASEPALPVSQFKQLKRLAKEWSNMATEATSWTAAAAYNDAAHTLAHWIETQQGVVK